VSSNYQHNSGALGRIIGLRHDRERRIPPETLLNTSGIAHRPPGISSTRQAASIGISSAVLSVDPFLKDGTFFFGDTKVCVSRRNHPGGYRSFPAARDGHLCAPPDCSRTNTWLWRSGCAFSQGRFNPLHKTVFCCALFFVVRLDGMTQAYLPLPGQTVTPRTISRQRSTTFFPHKMRSGNLYV